jgi:hypothetical protein
MEAHWRERFAQILSPLSAERPAVSLSSESRRSLGHLLRGISAIDKGNFAEDLIAEMFTLPLIKYVSLLTLTLTLTLPPSLRSLTSFVDRTHLTQGKIDGPEGRTSFSGLHSTLQTILQSLQRALHDPLVVSEEIFCATPATGLTPPPAVDLIIGGIWKPLSNALQVQCSGMFMTGITVIFHRTYEAIQYFLTKLSEICGSEWSERISRRLFQHETVIQFQQLWKLDLYFKVLLSPFPDPLSLSEPYLSFSEPSPPSRS